MEPKKVITVDLISSGVSKRTGLNYPDSVLMLQVVRLRKRGWVYGEYKTPKIKLVPGGPVPPISLVRENDAKLDPIDADADYSKQVGRVLSIVHGNVSHCVGNFRMEGNMIKADAMSTGPKAEEFEELHKLGKLHFGMRAFVRLDGMNVTKIENIVTFDLVSSPP